MIVSQPAVEVLNPVWLQRNPDFSTVFRATKNFNFHLSSLSVVLLLLCHVINRKSRGFLESLQRLRGFRVGSWVCVVPFPPLVGAAAAWVS